MDTSYLNTSVIMFVWLHQEKHADFMAGFLQQLECEKILVDEGQPLDFEGQPGFFQRFTANRFFGGFAKFYPAAYGVVEIIAAVF